MNIEEIETKLINKEILTDDEITIFLKYIVSEVETIVDKPNYENTCDLIQGIIGRYLNKLGILNYPSITNTCICSSAIGHSFLVANINGKLYLLDPSYRQFFYLNKEYQEMYIKGLKVKSFSPYHYALELNSKITIDFLTKGYMELTNEFAFVYGNSFAKTLTNVLDDYKFINIPGEVFIRSFLKGKESLRQYDYLEIKTNCEELDYLHRN